MRSAFGANGLYALPVALFIAHDDPFLKLAADYPLGVNTNSTRLSTMQRMLQRNFWAPHDIEDTHKEALGMANNRWARIFNHNRPSAGQTEDTPNRKIVWGKPEDISRHCLPIVLSYWYSGCFEDSAPQARVVAVWRGHDLALGGVKLFVLVHYALLSMHSAYFAHRSGNLYIFRCIPVYCVHDPPFKRDLKNSMHGWCLRRPNIMRLGIKHVVHTGALNVGMHLYEARQGHRVAIVKWRKQDTCPGQQKCGETMRCTPHKMASRVIVYGREGS